MHHTMIWLHDLGKELGGYAGLAGKDRLWRSGCRCWEAVSVMTEILCDVKL